MPGAILVLWLVAVVLSAYATIEGEYRGRRPQVYLCKPLTTVLILLGAVLAGGGGYRWLILAGLLCSLAGDVFLMLPSDRFRAGLASFLVAHLFYIAAFAQGLAWTWPSMPTLFTILGLWAVFLLLLLPGAAGQRLPVAVYGLVLLLMTAAGLARAGLLGGSALFAAAGALLFLVSDATIGINRFLRPVPAAQAIILGTYFPAQALIVLSIGS